MIFTKKNVNAKIKEVIFLFPHRGEMVVTGESLEGFSERWVVDKARTKGQLIFDKEDLMSNFFVQLDGGREFLEEYKVAFAILVEYSERVSVRFYKRTTNKCAGTWGVGLENHIHLDYLPLVGPDTIISKAVAIELTDTESVSFAKSPVEIIDFFNDLLEVRYDEVEFLGYLCSSRSCKAVQLFFLSEGMMRSVFLDAYLKTIDSISIFKKHNA